jgi:hypothetical protein
MKTQRKQNFKVSEDILMLTRNTGRKIKEIET